MFRPESSDILIGVLWGVLEPANPDQDLQKPENPEVQNPKLHN